MQQFIVPVDGSPESWRAVDVALGLVPRTSGRIEVVEVVFDANNVLKAEHRLEECLREHRREHEREHRREHRREHGIADVDITSFAVHVRGSVADAICQLVAERPGAMVIMASRGRGRSAAIVGSVAEEVLRRLDGPVLMVGPGARASNADGPMIVTVDGSDISEAALPIAAAWSLEFGTRPWIVEVVAPGDRDRRDGRAAAYLEPLSDRLSALSGSGVEHRVLHERSVEVAVADFATEIDASMIVASTSGRTAASRFLEGSTAAGFVRHAPCPVLLVRPQYAASTVACA